MHHFDAADKTAAGVTGGLWVLGTIGTTQISLVDFGVGTGLSILGAMTYQFFKAYCQREAEQAKGVPEAERTTVDYRTLTYACMGAPLAAGMLMWLISAAGGTANSLYSIGGFYGAGALAPQIIPLIFSKVLALTGGKPA